MFLYMLLFILFKPIPEIQMKMESKKQENRKQIELPGNKPAFESSIIFRILVFELIPPLEPGFIDEPSSNKSHIRKSDACSTNNSTVSPVRSIIAHTSSKLRSTNDIPFHSST